MFYIYHTNSIIPKVLQAILEEENLPYKLIQDHQKPIMMSSGASNVVICYNAEYIGYHYTHLTKYLEDKGLMQC